MRVVDWAGFPGPNLEAPVPAARVSVDFGPLVDRPVAGIGAAIAERLAHTAPQLVGARWPDSASTVAAHLRAAPAGTVPDLVAALALVLISESGGPVRFSAIRTDRTPSMRAIVVEAGVPEIGRAAVAYASALVGDALGLRVDGATFDRRAAHGAFERVARTAGLHGLSGALVRIAAERDLPHLRLWPRGEVVQIGQGRRRVRLMGTMSDRGTAIANRITADKSMTSGLLQAHGIPVPAFRRVESARAAVVAADALGYPVVVKPTDGKKGMGITLGLRDAAAVRAAFERAAAVGPVQVEREIPGDDHRLLVVDGHMIAAARRRSARIVGDGRRTVRELIAALNADPRRGPEHRAVLVTIALDDDVRRTLAEQGSDPDAVPGDGVEVLLRRTANVSSGGTMEDVTARVHPDCRRIAERATLLAGLDICGVDLIATDIARPPSETGAAICELNFMPGLRPHVGDPASPAVMPMIVDAVMPPGSDGRIPVAAIAGGGVGLAASVTRIMAATGACVGTAGRGGVAIGTERIAGGDRASAAGALMVFADAGVDIAVLETPRAAIVREGLGFDACTVAALLDPASDATTVAAMRLLAGRARGMVVLRAGDPRAPAILDGAAAPVAWVGGDETAARGRSMTVTAVGGRIVMRVDGSGMPVAPLPAGDPGMALAAAAIAWGLGAPAYAIARGLAG